MLISSWPGTQLGGGCDGEVGELGANAVDHGEDEIFDLLRLDLGFGEELGGAETKLGHFDFGDLAAGVNDQRQGAEGGLLAKPLDEREAVAVGEGEIEDEEVGGAVMHCRMACWREAAWSMWTAAFWKLAEDAGQVFVVFDEQDIGGAFSVMEDAA